MNSFQRTAFAIIASGVVTTTQAAQSTEAPHSISEEAQAFLNKARSGQLPSAPPMDDPKLLNRMRNALDNLFLRYAKAVDPDFFLTEQEMGTTKGYWVNTERPTKPDNVIMYLHGGGYILGSTDMYLASTLRIGPASGVPVITVDYRLAPEHKFPAAIEDALSGYRWLLDNGYDGEDIAIYGDSAGGGLTVALVQKIRAEKLPMPAAITLLSPAGDRSGDGDSRITLKDFDPVIRTNPTDNVRLYAGDADLKDPLLSPAYADYTGFPPMLIQVGTREILLSDSVRIARRARDAGVETVILDIREGMWHGWHDRPDLPEADSSCTAVAEFFNAQFAQHDGWF